MVMNFCTQSKPRPLPVIILIDTSGSMDRVISGEIVKTGRTVIEDGKEWNIVKGGMSAMMSLNKSLSKMLETFKDETIIGAEIQVSIITFGGDNAKIHTSLRAVKDILWEDMTASGLTPMGKAFNVARKLLEDKSKISSRAYTPAIVLISDGEPNDNWKEELKKLLNSERAKKADRMAMFIGDDSGEAMLKEFLADDSKSVFKADDADKIYEFFKFVTMSVTTRAQSRDLNKNKEAEVFFKRS